MTLLAASGRGMPTTFDHHPLFVEGFLVGSSDAAIASRRRLEARLSVTRGVARCSAHQQQAVGLPHER